MMKHFSRSRLLSVGVALSCTIALGWVPAAETVAAEATGGIRPHVRAVEDPVFDVQQPAEANSDDYVAAPDRTVGDITRVRLRHRQHRVTVKIRVQELTRPRGDDYQVVFAGSHIRTPRGTFYAYLVLDTDGRTVLFGRDGEEPTRCRGIRRDFDVDRDVVEVSVPRACLGRPRWVRAASAVSYSWPGGGDGDFYVDTAPDSEPLAAERTYGRRAWHPGS